MKTLFHWMVLSLTVVLLAACVPEAGDGNRSGQNKGALAGANGGTAAIGECTPEDGEAVICGQLVAADGVTPIVGASISMLRSDGNKQKLKDKQQKENPGFGNGDFEGFDTSGDNDGSNNDRGADDECRTNSKGRFACGGIEEEGKKQFKVEKDGKVDKVFEREVEIDRTTEVEERVEREEHKSRWLVVPGAYDGVQLLLSQLKGCTLRGNPLRSWELRGSAECEAAGLTVLESYQVSGFSFLDLNQYDFIFINCPTNMSAHASALQAYAGQGGNIYFSDWAHDGLETSFPGQVLAGSRYDTKVGVARGVVRHGGLKSFLGTSGIDVIFDLPIWVPISDLASDVRTFISGDTSYVGGAKDAPLTVGWKADTVSGCVFFTSYHIEGASTGAAQEKSLKYLIQNLDEVCVL